MTAFRNVITEPKFSNGQSQSKANKLAYVVRVSRDVDHRYFRRYQDKNPPDINPRQKPPDKNPQAKNPSDKTPQNKFCK